MTISYAETDFFNSLSRIALDSMVCKKLESVAGYCYTFKNGKGGPEDGRGSVSQAA